MIPKVFEPLKKFYSILEVGSVPEDYRQISECDKSMNVPLKSQLTDVCHTLNWF